MLVTGGFLPMLAANSMDTVLNTAGIGLLVVGVLLLFAGVKLVRLICTLAFATVGAAVGMAVNTLLKGVVDVPGSPWWSRSPGRSSWVCPASCSTSCG